MLTIMEKDSGEAKYYSKRLMRPTTGVSYGDPVQNKLSFNSPEGACPHCKGLGNVNRIDLGKVFPDTSSPSARSDTTIGQIQEPDDILANRSHIRKKGCTLDTPVKDIQEEATNEILYGLMENVRIRKEMVHTRTTISSGSTA